MVSSSFGRLFPIVDDLITGAPPGLMWSLFLNEDMVRDGIPGVMNAHKEQQQCRRTSAEQRRAHVVAGSARGDRQHRVRREGQQGMTQPILELGLVRSLYAHPSSHNKGVRHPAEAE